MAAGDPLYLGEWTRSLDERYRLTLPLDLAEMIASSSGQCVLAKERPGCVSLWEPGQWDAWLEEGVSLISGKIQSGRLAGRFDQLQMFGRLLSTRHRRVPIAGRGRVTIPESFRSFLAVEPGEEVLVVGAAVCVELWQSQRWSEHIGAHMPQFRQLFDELAN